MHSVVDSCPLEILDSITASKLAMVFESLNVTAPWRTVELKTIRRQVDREYRDVIQEISKGNAESAFRQLERQGAIEVLPESKRHSRLATEYCVSMKQEKSALIVCPTWREIEAVTKSVRQKLRTEGCCQEMRK